MLETTYDLFADYSRNAVTFQYPHLSSLSLEQPTKMMTYQYQPLQKDQHEIRLITLLPGAPGDPIRILIYHSSLTPSAAQGRKENKSQQGNRISYPWKAEETSDGDTLYLNTITNETSWTHPSQGLVQSTTMESDFQPQYEALSYTWGASENPETVYVMSSESDEVEKCATLEVYANLASAFRHLRFLDQVRTFWVDAICINQQDIPERNTQVKRMANIYSSAYRIVAWLGSEAYSSARALATLQYIGDQLEILKTGRVVRAPEAHEPDLWMNACKIHLDESTWQALMRFLDRSWFYRLWCWQEINLSSRHTIIQCGHDQIRWTVFRRAVLCIHNKEELPSIIFREHCRHIAMLTADARVHPMSIMLDLSRSKGCAEPRDKVYGLLGLTAPLFSASVKTDYSLPLEQVYKETFLAHAGITQRLELLKHCVIANRSIGGPSWVPDWSKTDFAAPLISEQLATGVSNAHFKYVEPYTLEAVGLRCADVHTVSAAASKEIYEALWVIPEWLNSLPTSDVYVNGQKMIEAFAMVLSMNRTCERHPTNHFLSTLEFVNLLQKIVSLDAGSNVGPVYSEREVGNIIQKIRGRAFFVTRDGHIGIAPEGIQAGEIDGMITYWVHGTDLRIRRSGVHLPWLLFTYYFAIE